MHRSKFRALSLAILAFGAVVLASSFASASFINLGPAGDFNVWVINDNTQSGSDAEGRVAVGRDALFGAWSVGTHVSASTDNLIVGRNLTNSNNTVKGGLLVNGNVNWTNPTITGRVSVNGDANFNAGGGGQIGTPVTVGGTYTAPNYYPAATVGTTPLPFVFSDVADYLTDLADFLAAQPMNGATSFISNNIYFNGTDPNFNNFYVTAAQVAAGTGVNITAPVGSTVVVNIDGAAATFASQGVFVNGVNKQNVLFNFYNAATLNMHSIGVNGSLLAPRADVNFGFGNIDGTLIAYNLTGPGESHHFPFQGNLPPIVPEPSTAILAGMTIFAIAARRR
jgi:choice-of-anchor A domain-containing protein